MKTLTIACVALGMFAAGQAFADTTAPAQTQTSAAAPNAQVDSGVSQPETRGQVYHDLVHAEHDGQLKQLNSTIYAHH
jgi:hypothetical protein